MELENKEENIKIQNFFIECLLELFSYWICYQKAFNPDKCPPFSNEEGAESLLQMDFKDIPNELFEYLAKEKSAPIEEHITPCADRIKYIHDDGLTIEEIATAKEFKKQTANTTFLHIIEILHTLLKNYTDRINEEDAIRRTKALILKKKTTSITEATSEAIEIWEEKDSDISPKRFKLYHEKCYVSME